MITKTRFLPLLPLCLVIILGCKGSSSPSNVSGKITYTGANGKVPVTGGMIEFHPAEGGTFSYVIGSDGSYLGAALPVGDYAVTIDTEAANPKPEGRPTMDMGKDKSGYNPSDVKSKMQAMGKAPEQAATMGPYVKIPAKYGDKTTSGLKVTLKKGKNENNFDLTD